MNEDRSKSMRDPRPEDMEQLDLGGMEVRDLDGYAKQTQTETESSLWSAEPVWQEDQPDSVPRAGCINPAFVQPGSSFTFQTGRMVYTFVRVLRFLFLVFSFISSSS